MTSGGSKDANASGPSSQGHLSDPVQPTTMTTPTSTVEVPTSTSSTGTVESAVAPASPQPQPRAQVSAPIADVGPVPMAPPAHYVSPAQYGALGNGTSDDTTAVQDAINAAAAAGEVVWLPAQSTYVISGRLTVPSNTTIEGAGVSSVLRFTWTSGARGAHYIENADPSGGDTNITLSNFTLLGSGSGEPAGTNAQNGGNLVSAVNVELATHWTIAHLQIEDSPGPSITYHGGSDITIEYNDCHNGGRDGITGYWDQGPSITNLSDVVIADNQISEVGDDAIAVLGAANNLRNPSGPLPSDITIEDNRIVGWPSNVNGSMLGRGINVSVVGPNVTVTDNYIENTYSAGLMISGCTSKWCPSGYKNWQTTGVSATDNTIVNAGQLYAGSTEGQHNQPGYGIYVANSAAPITVTGNTITNAALGNVEVASCSGGCQIQSG